MNKKIISLMLVMILSVSMFTACSSNGSSTKNGDEDNSVRIALMTTGHTVPIYYAELQGYFTELGLDVSIEYFSNGPAINEAIASGEIDFASMGEMPAITGAITNNSKVVGWMTDDEASIQCYARKDSDIVKAGKGNISDYPEIYGTAKEWKGKEIIVAKGTSSHYGLLATLEALGLKESDVKIINMEGTAGAAAFASGTGDIFFGFDPQWAEFYTNSDEYTQISTCENAGKSLYNVMVASEDFYKNGGDKITKVIQAIIKADQEFVNSTDTYHTAMYDWQNTYGSCIQELANFSADIKKVETLDGMKSKFEQGDDGKSEAEKSFDTVAQFMVDNQVISAEDKETFDNINAIDATYYNEAIENLRVDYN